MTIMSTLKPTFTLYTSHIQPFMAQAHLQRVYNSTFLLTWVHYLGPNDVKCLYLYVVDRKSCWLSGSYPVKSSELRILLYVSLLNLSSCTNCRCTLVTGPLNHSELHSYLQDYVQNTEHRMGFWGGKGSMFVKMKVFCGRVTQIRCNVRVHAIIPTLYRLLIKCSATYS